MNLASEAHQRFQIVHLAMLGRLSPELPPVCLRRVLSLCLCPVLRHAILGPHPVSNRSPPTPMSRLCGMLSLSSLLPWVRTPFLGGFDGRASRTAILATAPGRGIKLDVRDETRYTAVMFEVLRSGAIMKLIRVSVYGYSMVTPRLRPPTSRKWSSPSGPLVWSG